MIVVREFIAGSPNHMLFMMYEQSIWLSYNEASFVAQFKLLRAIAN